MPDEKKQIRMSIFRPVEPEKNQYLDLMNKYKTMNVSTERLRHEIMMDMKKLSDMKTDNSTKRNKRYNFYHYIFKPKFLLPFVYFAKRKMSKQLPQSRTDIPDEPYNKNAQILWDVWEKTYYDWVKTFKEGSPNNEYKTEEQIRKVYTNDIKNEVVHCYHVPDFMVKFMINVYLEDTAYREMINMYLFNLQGEMNKTWNPEIQHKFPMYTVLYDMFIPYFCEWLKLNGGGSFMINVDPNPVPNPNIDKDHLDKMAKELNFQQIKTSIDEMNKVNGRVNLEENKQGVEQNEPTETKKE